MIDFLKPMVIAELGMTHDGSFGQAEAMIRVAKDCEVEAVKLQMHISAEETIRNAPQPPYFHAEPRYEYFERTAFSMEQWRNLLDIAHQLDLLFIVSPFSIEAIRRLMDIGVDAIKIPSGEITNIPYLEYLAECDVPVIISSGMSSLEELDDCMRIFKVRKAPVALMQCTSEYPCTPEHIGLNIIDLFRERYPGIPLGISDHSAGEWASIAAYVKSAHIIEKHFTLSKHMYGPDAAMSMEPEEMHQLCTSIHNLDIALKSNVDKADTSALESMKRIFQKSIVAACDICEGTVITEGMLAYKKPGDGLETKFFRQLIGKKIRRSLHKDEQFRKEDIGLA